MTTPRSSLVPGAASAVRVDPRILLVGPDALPTGATLLLLALVRWTRRALPVPPRAVLLAPGPLQPAFRAAGARVLGVPRTPALFAEQVARRLGQPRVATAVRRARHAPVYRRPPQPRVVFATTVQAAGPSLRFLSRGTRLVTYAVEPGDVLDELVNPAMMGRLAAKTFLWLAASDDVAAGLVARGVPDDRVVVVSPFLDFVAPDPHAVREARARCGVDEGRVIVGGVGRSDWRDGPDAFLRMASVLRRRHPDLPVHFLWVGAPDDGPTRWILDHDVRHARLSDVTSFAGQVGEYDRWVGAFDVLAVTSRIDPAPPASLVAGAAGVATVAFSTQPDSRSGAPVGAGEGSAPAIARPQLDELGVEVVPYLDVEAMAERIAELVADAAERAASGRRRRAIARAMGSVDERAATLWELLEICAGRAPKGAMP